MKKLGVLALGVMLGTSAWSQTFKFTAIPDQNAHHLEERFSKIARYFEEELGVEVVYVPVKSYSASVAAFQNNEVQLAWFGGLSGVQARRAVPGSVALAQGEEDKAFRTYFIANAKTGLEKAENLNDAIKGHTFTFGSKGSTSGRLMPEFYIRKHFGEAPRKVFKRVGYSGDHSKTIATVQSGAFEVGAVNFQVWERELKEGKIDQSQVRVIWTTPAYPDYNWTIRGDADNTFGPGFTDKVRKALLEMDDPDLLKSFPRTRFIPADNNMYQPILDTALEVGLIDG